MPPDATEGMLLDMIGPARSSILARRQRISGITASRLIATRSMPGGCAASSNWSPRKVNGAVGAEGPRPRHRRAPSFVSYVATVVEVAIDTRASNGAVRVDTAIDCGTFVNPERIESQIEGAAIMGLSLAKYGEVTFKDGRVVQNNFDDFPGRADR